MLPYTTTTQVSRILLVLAALAGLLSAGCTTRVYGRGYARSYVRYSAPPPVVFVQAPELVYVEPGLYVVRDYDDPVYYSDGYYWSYRGGLWYRTAHWSDPWVTVHVSAVPHTCAYRDHRAYVHYHGSAGAVTYRQPARTYHTAAVSHHHHASAPPSPAPAPHAKGSAPGGAGHVVHTQDNHDRAAARSAEGRSARADRASRSDAGSGSQAKVLAPPDGRQATAERRPARRDSDRKPSRSSDSSSSRSKKKSKRR